MPTPLVALRAATLALAVFLPVDARSQEAASAQASGAETTEPSETADGLPTQSLSVEEVQAKLAEIEADAGMDESVKSLLRPKYEQAIELLEKAAAHAAKAEEYRQAIETAPEKTAELQAERESLPPPEAIQADAFTGDLDELQRDLESRRGQLESLNAELSQVTATLAQIRARPVEISERLSEVERELSDVRGQLQTTEPAETDSPGRTADRVVLQSRAQALQNELQMLEFERASRSAREALLEAQRELLEKQVARAQREVDVLASVVQQRLSQDVVRMETLAEAGLETLADGDPEARALATEVKELAELYQTVVSDLKEVDAAREQIGEKLRELQAEDESIRSDLSLGAAGGTMAQVLLEWRLNLYEENARVMRIFNDAVSADQARLHSLEVGAKLRQQPAVTQRFADHRQDAVAELVEARGEVLEKLRQQYSLLIRGLASLETGVDKYRRDVENAQDYITQQLFWLRSSPPVGLRTFEALPSSVRWLLAAQHGVDLANLAVDRVANMPIRYGLAILFALTLLSLRSRLDDFVTATGRKIRRISTDKYRFTSQALLATLLMAVPLPLLLWMIGSSLGGAPTPSGWVRGFAYGLNVAALVLLFTRAVADLTRDGGVAQAHFGWRGETLRRLRRTSFRFSLVYVPTVLITIICLFGPSYEYVDSLGRLSFAVGQVWTAYLLWKLLRHSGGILSWYSDNAPDIALIRSQPVWVPAVIAIPLLLVLLAAAGYTITALRLTMGFLLSAALVFLGITLYWFSLRWFRIRERQLALAEGLEQRRARQAKPPEESKPSADGSAELIEIEDAEEESIDLDAISDQTRHVLSVVFGLMVVGVLIWVWNAIFPIGDQLTNQALPVVGSLLGLAEAVLIIAVTYVITTNLPGLLELSVLQATNIESGTRHAIATLCQYAVIGVGAAFLLEVLDVDWAKFSWIAAALSVGLGFGLQEIVANFVCGLILLFERPIRVGDIVTVEGMTGTVTRIRMRATTITDWDRQEFVVPNKNLITGTILNWTLTAAINRVAVPVGVAYGTDTETAREIMLSVANDHPHVLEEPAPMALFEGFGDSSLNLRLLAFLPNLQNRLSTITELHAEIDRRFAAADIQIPFPQRDIHVRDGATLETTLPSSEQATG